MNTNRYKRLKTKISSSPIASNFYEKREKAHQEKKDTE